MHSPYEAGCFIEFWFFLFLCKQKGWSWNCLEGELCGFGCRVWGGVSVGPDGGGGRGWVGSADLRGVSQQSGPGASAATALPRNSPISRDFGSSAEAEASWDEKHLRAPGASEDAPVRKEFGSHHQSSKSQSASPALPPPPVPYPPPPAIVTGHSPQGPGKALGTRLWPKGCAVGRLPEFRTWE